MWAISGYDDILYFSHLLAAYLGILEEENDVLRMYAGAKNCWFEVFLEVLDPIVVGHVHANEC